MPPGRAEGPGGVLVAGSEATPVPDANAYDRVAVTIADPDGRRVVLIAEGWPS